MRTVTITRDEHWLLRFSFDAETARNTGFAAFTMDSGVAKMMAEDIIEGGDCPSRPFVGIVHDGGEIVIALAATSEI